MFRTRIVAAATVAVALTGCDKPVPPAPVRPVRAITIECCAKGEMLSITGQIKPRNERDLAFRLDGRMMERPVHVGDMVNPGQALAWLDPQNQQNALRSAQANLASAEAQLVQARLNFGRQQQLLKNGWTAQARFDDAQQALRTAEAQVDSSRAQLRTAQNQQSYTVLTADAPGVVTAVGAEPGEVVRTGQMIIQMALLDGRDAVFDVPEQAFTTVPRDALVDIALTSDAKITALGRVREVAPQADSVTRTFTVKVGILNPPDAMRLGTTVTGRIQLPGPAGFQVPASALTEDKGHPAVWIVDPANHQVSLRQIDVDRYDPNTLVVSHGINSGETIVTAGTQTLRPGQQVQVLGERQ